MMQFLLVIFTAVVALSAGQKVCETTQTLQGTAGKNITLDINTDTKNLLISRLSGSDEQTLVQFDNGKLIQGDPKKFHRDPNTGAVSIKSLSADDAGLYRAQTFNGKGPFFFNLTVGAVVALSAGQKVCETTQTLQGTAGKNITLDISTDTKNLLISRLSGSDEQTLVQFDNGKLIEGDPKKFHRDPNTGAVSIKSLSADDTGLYIAQTFNGKGPFCFNLTVGGSMKSVAAGSTNGILLGITVPLVIILLVLLVLFVFWIRRKTSSEQTVEQPDNRTQPSAAVQRRQAEEQDDLCEENQEDPLDSNNSPTQLNGHKKKKKKGDPVEYTAVCIEPAGASPKKRQSDSG